MAVSRNIYLEEFSSLQFSPLTDVLQLYGLSVDLPDGLYAETRSVIRLGATIQNMAVDDLPLSTVQSPSFRLKVYASTAGNSLTDITGRWEESSLTDLRSPIKHGEAKMFDHIEVSCTFSWNRTIEKL